MKRVTRVSPVKVLEQPAKALSEAKPPVHFMPHRLKTRIRKAVRSITPTKKAASTIIIFGFKALLTTTVAMFAKDAAAQEAAALAALNNVPPVETGVVKWTGENGNAPEKNVATPFVAPGEDEKNKSAKAKEDPTPKKKGYKPGTVPVFGQKYFNTQIVGDTVIGFTDVQVGDMGSFELKVGKYLAAIGETSLTNRIGEAYGQNPDGTVGYTCVFPHGLLGFQIQNIDTLSIKPIAVRTIDKNPNLQDNIVSYGAEVAVISVSGIMTTDGLGTTFSLLFDAAPQPEKLINPKLYVDPNTKDITITADNIRTKEGKPGYYFISYSGKVSIEENINLTLNQ
jgi:hypothetical protein